MNNPSNYLNARQYAGLLHVGDVLIPGRPDLPSFRHARCAHHVDRMLAWMNAADLSGLKALLTLLSFTPALVIRGIFAMADRADRFPEPIAAILRMANIGLKGTIMTLYYSDIAEGAPIFGVMGWDAKIVESSVED